MILQTDLQNLRRKQKVYGIVNLHSGAANEMLGVSETTDSVAQKNNRIAKEIKKHFPDSLVVFTTEQKKSASRLAYAYMQGILKEQEKIDDAHDTANANTEMEHLILVFGGDGTIGQVVHGLFHALLAHTDSSISHPDLYQEKRKKESNPYQFSEQLLSLLPKLGVVNTGSGGDLARYLDLPSDFSVCLEIIKKGKSRSIDVGRLESYDLENQKRTFFFLNVASVGLSAEIADRVNRKKRKNFMSYFLASFRENLTAKKIPLQVQVHSKDGTRQTIESSAILVAICNGKFFGQGMEIAPYALAEDGLFDVTIFHQWNRLLAPLQLRRLYKGTLYRSREVQALRCRQIEISASPQSAMPVVSSPLSDASKTAPKTAKKSMVLIEIDGELIGQLPLTADLIHKGLRVCVR